MKKLAEKLGKTPVIVNKDIPGFVANRIAQPAILEAMRLYERGVASARDVDNSMKLGFNWPMGPLELSDLMGLDVILNIAEYIHRETGDPLYQPPLILKQMVRCGFLGRKQREAFILTKGGIRCNRAPRTLFMKRESKLRREAHLGRQVKFSILLLHEIRN